MAKIFHEMPLAMLKTGEENYLADGHYALVHLYEQLGTDYYKHSVNTLKQGRELIVDNSIFELGTAFEPTRFAGWLAKLAKDAGYDVAKKNLVYIIPDVLDDYKATVASAKAFIEMFPVSLIPGKRMAVAQGKTYEELIKCYEELVKLPEISRIGISFNSEAYGTSNQEFSEKIPESALLKWANGRVKFIRMLEEKYSGNPPVPLHLLGCSVPQEFKNYKGINYIESVDTSNPIVHGLYGIEYQEDGLKEKVSIKVADLMHKVPSAEEIRIIYKNVARFRSFLYE